MGHSLTRDKRVSLVTEALMSLQQECTGRAASECTQQATESKGRTGWLKSKSRDLYLEKNILYQSPMCKNMLTLPLL